MSSVYVHDSYNWRDVVVRDCFARQYLELGVIMCCHSMLSCVFLELGVIMCCYSMLSWVFLELGIIMCCCRYVACCFNSTRHWMPSHSSVDISTSSKQRLEVPNWALNTMHGWPNSNCLHWHLFTYNMLVNIKAEARRIFSSELYLWTLGQLRGSRPNTAGLNVRPSV